MSLFHTRHLDNKELERIKRNYILELEESQKIRKMLNETLYNLNECLNEFDVKTETKVLTENDQIIIDLICKNTNLLITIINRIDKQ